MSIADFTSVVSTLLPIALPDAEHARDRLDVIATMLGRQFPKVETMLREAADAITAFADFPVAHWKQIWSTKPLERVNKDIKRRTDVVGVFPNPAALLRLAGTVLIATHDESEVSDRRYLSERSMAQLTTATNQSSKEVAVPDLIESRFDELHCTADHESHQLHHAVGRDPLWEHHTLGFGA